MKHASLNLLVALIALANAFPAAPSTESTFLISSVSIEQAEQPLVGYQTCPGNCHAPTGCCTYLAGLWYCGICDKKDESPDKIGKVIDDIGEDDGVESMGRDSL